MERLEPYEDMTPPLNEAEDDLLLLMTGKPQDEAMD